LFLVCDRNGPARRRRPDDHGEYLDRLDR
jgi:hypothetical protein